MALELDKIFESFDKNTIFKDKTYLQTNYQPEEIPHRDDQIKQIASKPVLDLLRTVKRPLLHAYHLTFCHPDTGAPLSFEVPLPADFADILTLLRSWHA